MDRLTPLVIPRWGFFCAIFLLYAIRVFILDSYYLVTYCLAIYLLNLLVAFLSPVVRQDQDLARRRLTQPAVH